MRSGFDRERVVSLLRQCWSPRTSSGWRADNPARGQCNVTALLINDVFGGEILKTALPEGDHFYNRIDGRRLDLTESQFAAPIGYLDLPSGREEALAGTTPEKYAILLAAYRRLTEGGG